MEETDQEKRRYDRCSCSGEARMQIPPEQAGIDGRILDLSLGGCMIEFYTPQVLERDQRVELVFCVHNLPFHVAAIVKSLRSMTEFGFEFPEMRERARVQMEELVDELKHPPSKRGRVIPITAYRLR